MTLSRKLSQDVRFLAANKEVSARIQTMEQQAKLAQQKAKAKPLGYKEFMDAIDFSGGTKRHDPFHFALIEGMLAHSDGRKLILCPRAHLKSTLGTVFYVLYRIYLNPNIRIMVACANKGLATGFVRQIKQYLENVELQEKVWHNRPHVQGPLVPQLERTQTKRKYSRRTIEIEDDDGDSYEATEAVDKKVVWRSDAIQVIRDYNYKEPTVYASSVGSTVTGWHFDLIIFDDIVTFQNSDTLAKAEKILSWTRDIESVLNPYNAQDKLGGEIVIIGTPYYPWDYYSHLLGYSYLEDNDLLDDYLQDLQQDNLWVMIRDIYGYGYDGPWLGPNKVEYNHKYVYSVKQLPKRAKYDVGHPVLGEGYARYMCPNLFNQQLETRLKRRLGLTRFNSQYLIKCEGEEFVRKNVDETIYFLPPYAFTRDTRNNTVVVRVPNDDVLDAQDEQVVIRPYLFVDPAASLSEDADYSCILVGGKTPDGRLWVLDTWMGRCLTSELSNRIEELATKWGVTFVVFETSGQQIAIANTLKDYWRVKRKRLILREYRPVGVKLQRIVSTLEPLFQSQHVYLNAACKSQEFYKEIRHQVANFPEPTSHDDFLDALASLYVIALPLGIDKDGKRIGIKQTEVKHRLVNPVFGGYR